MIKQVLFDGKVEVGISEIGDGNMRFFGDGDEAEIIENQKKLCRLTGLGDAARIRTIYGDRQRFTDYFEITSENLSEYTITNSEEQIPISDGLITRKSGVGLLLPLADCLGMVVFDEENGAVGLLHAGRQNIEQYGPKKFIEFFVKESGGKPEKLKIYFSPHAVEYPMFKFSNKPMPEVVRKQLAEAGVLQENITDSKTDTVSSESFPSNSSGDTKRRFAIVAKMI